MLLESGRIVSESQLERRERKVNLAITNPIGIRDMGLWGSVQGLLTFCLESGFKVGLSIDL